MEIRKIPIEHINPAPYNPRRDLRPGEREYDAIEGSLTRFGQVVPLVWNERTGNLVGGHQRLKILADWGAKEVECSVVNLDESQERALNLALNKAQGTWDYDMLREVIRTIVPEELGFTGFSPEELRVLRGDADAAAANIGAMADEFDTDLESNEGGEDDQDDDWDGEVDDDADVVDEMTQEGDRGEGSVDDDTDGAGSKPWTLYISLPTEEAGNDWLAENGFTERFAAGKHTVNIRMED